MKTINKSSGIKGVTLLAKNNGKNKYWVARVQGRINISKRFPFTERGKELAAILPGTKKGDSIEQYNNVLQHAAELQDTMLAVCIVRVNGELTSADAPR